MNNSLALNEFIKTLLKDEIPRNEEEEKEVNLIKLLWEKLGDDQQSINNLSCLVEFYHTKNQHMRHFLDLICDKCSECSKFQEIDFDQ